VYRAFGAGDVLLYVGVAGNWGHRWSQHSLRSAFFAEVLRLEIEWLPSREAALRLEAALIREFRPRFNIRSGALPRARRHWPQRAPLDLACDRCGCYYLEDEEWGSVLGAECGDLAANFERPCQGRLVLQGQR